MDLPVCAVVVAYNCGAGVGPTIRSVLPQAERVLVVDNGSTDGTRSFLEAIRAENASSVETIFLPENTGIAGALNFGARRAVDLGYEWFLTMDDDSVADSRMLEALKKAAFGSGDPGRILLAAPVYTDENTGEEGRLFRYCGWRRERLRLDGPDGAASPTVVIASGNLVSAKAWRAVGGYDESLFIDYVDHDFCLKGILCGYRIVATRDARLRHAVGSASARRMLGRTWHGTNHPPFRRYFIGRNRMAMIRRYAGAFPAYAVHAAMEYPADLLGMLICEKGAGKKAGALLSGAWSSLRGREAEQWKAKR